MSFVDGFYSFRIDLNNSNQEVYENIRLKLAKHPNESFYYMLSRLIAYLFVYEAGLKFTDGLFEPKEATFKREDVIGNILHYGQVGIPEKKKLKHACKHNPNAKFSVFFIDNLEIDKFCHFLKGSTENWVSNIDFYLVEFLNFEQLSSNLGSSNYLIINIFDSEISLIHEDNKESKCNIRKLNIWDYYQLSIENTQ